jgi:hypothetical protein
MQMRLKSSAAPWRSVWREAKHANPVMIPDESNMMLIAAASSAVRHYQIRQPATDRRRLWYIGAALLFHIGLLLSTLL